MNRRLLIQTLLVFGIIALVSWPEIRQPRPLSVWRYVPDLEQTVEAEELAAFSATAEERRRSGYSTDVTLGGNAPLAPGGVDRRLRPGERPQMAINLPVDILALGAKVNAVMGRARTSLNTPIPYARLILRDIRTGAIIGRVTANEEGRYSFLDVGASAYVVELIGPDGSVVAASEMVAMAPGDVRETTVRVGANAISLAAQFSGRLSASLADTLNAAGDDVGRATDPTMGVPVASPRF
jgi:hypothetical protein